MSFPDFDNEQARIDKLRQLGILDTPAEPAFDQLTYLAANICKTPIALISLVDQDRQWFKSKIGLNASETPRVVAFCAHTIHEKGPLIVRDAAKDRRFMNNPLVTGEPFIRFYAGFPLVTDEGFALGTLNVIDTEARELSQSQQEVLLILADQAVTLLKLREQTICLATANQELEAGRENYRIVTQSASDVILSIDENNQIILVNPAVEKVFGYRPEELIGQSIGALMPASLPGKYMAGLRHHAANRQKRISSNGVEVPVRHRDGHEIQIEISFGEYRRDGKSVLTAVIRDVTRRKLADEILKQSEQYHRSLFRTANDAIIIFDAQTQVIFDVNERACEIYGIRREEFIGKKLKDVSHDPVRSTDFLNSLLKRGTQEEYETIHYRSDGTPIHFLVNASIIEYQGKTAVISINRDVTHLKQVEDARRHLEAQLRQSQKMESIGTLAGGVAHDFNNLLTVIIGNIGLARKKLEPDSPVQTRLNEIEIAATRAASLTEQLLAFSRRQRLERKRLNLNDVLSNVLKMLRRIIGEDIEIEIQPSADLKTIYADPAQIEQVIMNLAVNARDAMPQGGRLMIETRNVVLDEKYHRSHAETKPGEYVLLLVSDTGEGMSSEVQERAFEPFYTTKSVGKGTGLGLSMVYGIVKQHEGHLEMDSEPGRGTTFKIYFPVEENILAEDASRKPAAFKGGTETILVAEDEEPLRQLVRQILEELGYTVILACDGVETVEQFDRFKDEIDLVLIDLVMPRLGGTRTCEQIRSLKKEIPVIFMTGYSDKVIDEQNAELIQKPYSIETLGRKIREVLDRQTS